MNKTVTVNIGGIVFHIDENAYERFKQYLESIRSHFSAADGRDEIMQDIEARIAEMFQERVKDSKQVITLDDVEEVTTQMGRPEQFEVSEEKTPSAETQAPVDSDGKIKRRLFRNPDDKLLGGVCSGISAYFDIDPVWIRLAFAFIFFVYGSGFLLYILLWIIIPEAKTTAEKLQMKGEPVTVSNIEKNVKEEMEQLKNRVNELSKDGGKKAGTVVGRIFEAIGQVFKFIFMLIGKLIAVFFIFIGLVVAFAMFMSLFALFHVPGTHYPAIWNQVFPTGSQFAFAFIGVVLLVGIPFLMLAYAGARMLFNIRRSSRIVGFTALGLWLAGLGICILLGVHIAQEFSERQNVKKELTLLQPPAGTLYLQMNEKKNEEKDYDDPERENRWDDDWHVMFNNNQLVSRKIKLDIVKSKTDSFELEEIFYARGGSRKEALDNATHIRYSFSQEDSLLKFDRFFTMNEGERFHSQKVQLVLRVPLNKRVHLDGNLSRFIYDIDNVQNVLDNDMLNRSWVMTEKGLSCTDCDGSESTLNGENLDIHGDDGSHVKVDESGVHITGPQGEKISVDSNGVVIQKNGEKVVKIDRHGMKLNESKKKKKE